MMLQVTQPMSGYLKWLDLVEYNDWKTLTNWGEEIINSPLGINKTAKKAIVCSD